MDDAGCVVGVCLCGVPAETSSGKLETWVWSQWRNVGLACSLGESFTCRQFRSKDWMGKGRRRRKKCET